MRVFGTINALVMLVLFAGGCAGPGTGAGEQAELRPVADQPEDVQPLDVGERAAVATLRTADDEPVDLADAYRRGPTALIFYRGGWCPFCTTHLSELGEAEAELVDAGFQILAVTPDRPANLREAAQEHDVGYALLSDSDMDLARAFGLAFQVDAETIERYRGFDIDLEQASGRSHHMMPVPAVYLVDRDGMIRFAYWNPDHRERLSGEALLDAARSITAE